MGCAFARRLAVGAGWKQALFAFVWALLLLGSVRAQVLPVGDPLEAYARLLQLEGLVPAGSFSVRPQPVQQWFGHVEASARHPWRRLIHRYTATGDTAGFVYGVLDPTATQFWNSARPWGQNDGAVWQGRGSTFALSTGVFGRYGVVSAALRPRFIRAENRDFELSIWPVASRQSAYAYPLRNDIDLPQRFGPEAFTLLDLGESYLRLDYRGFALGLSNENMWWGPGWRNAIVMSNNAAGFGHAFLGTSRPVNISVGHIQGRWVWGRLTESDYFIDVSDNLDEGEKPGQNRRFLTGIVLDFMPEWIPGLSLGAAHTYLLHAMREPGLAAYLGVFNLPFFNSEKDDPTYSKGADDKLLSLYARWLLPESGFEVYFEWARGDHTSSVRDVLVEPDHARGYTLGLQKSFVLAPAWWLHLAAEHTTLEAPRESGTRDMTKKRASYFYTHEGIKQGYTQRGQVIGAGIGPGANAQFVGLDLYAPWGKAGLFGFRQVHDNDRYYSWLKGQVLWYLHEVELGFGAEALLFVKGFEIGGAVAYARLLNKDYLFKNDETNVNVTVSLRRSIMGYR